MSQGKMSTIREVAYHSQDYYLGLDYLKRNHPDNSHLRSCYEGVSFRNLAQCVMFDRSRRVLKLDRYLERPQRFVQVSMSGKIIGVMVTISLPEFYHEIEYEDYAAIGTETVTDFGLFLDSLSFTGKAEIVTFNDGQAQLVESRFAIREIHHWSVFAYQGELVPGITANTKLMDESDSNLAELLSKQLPEESSPFRSLQFQLNGFPYENYTLSFEGGVSVFVGIFYSSVGICELKYLVDLGANNELLLACIGMISRLVQDSGHKLIWRMRKSDVTRYKALIKLPGFVELTTESHLHLR